MSAALLIIAGLLAMAQATHAQSTNVTFDNVGGTEYLVAFPDTVGNQLDPAHPNTRVRAEAALWIFSAVANSVDITYNGTTTTRTLNAGRFTTIDVPNPWPVVAAINTPLKQAVRVKARHPIIVICYLATIQGVEAWTPLPVDVWGKRYVTEAMPGDYVADVKKVNAASIDTAWKAAPGEILVIAAHDSTIVSFMPPLVSFVGGPPFTVKLDAGDVYQMQGYVDLRANVERQPDIATTIITANKPIGVISGNTRSTGAVSLVDEPMVLGNAGKNLMIESLTPTDMHGYDFIYMGTWDSYRPGIGAAAERMRELVRVFSTQERLMTGYSKQQGTSTDVPFNVRRDTLHDIAAGSPVAFPIHTSEPSQVMMASSEVVRFNGSTPCGAIDCRSYSAWAPYMVDMAPRERWTSFAPYYAPPNPGGMQHYINVVTDTNSIQKVVRENGTPFLFNRKIPGTDLIWGSMAITPGEDHWLVGKNGAKFWGFVYGLLGGSEDWGPSSYEEINAVSYGYPLVASNNVRGIRDTARIDTSMECGAVTIDVTLTNESPAGLRSIDLADSSANARLVAIAPANIGDVSLATHAVVRVEAIDPLKPASALVVITDRTGASWSVPFSYAPALATFGGNEFGEISVNARARRSVKVYNRTAVAITIAALSLARGDQGYTIVSSTPAVSPQQSVTLAPGDSMTVVIELKPTVQMDLYNDTLRVSTPCLVMPLPLVARNGAAIASVGDLDFGTMQLNSAPRSLWLRFCNVGSGGLITFENTTGGDLLQWSDSAFTVDSASLARLKSAALGAGGCDSVLVTFTPSREGEIHTTARFWSSTRAQRDTSIWSARVFDTSLAVPGDLLSGSGLRARVMGSMVFMNYTLPGRGHARLEVFNSVGEIIGTLFDEESEAGAHALMWDGSREPSGVYYCRMTFGGSSRTVPIVLAR
jgi:hypothetical protein